MTMNNKQQFTRESVKKCQIYQFLLLSLFDRKASSPRQQVLLVSQVLIPKKGFVAKGTVFVSVPSFDS